MNATSKDTAAERAAAMERAARFGIGCLHGVHDSLLPGIVQALHAELDKLLAQRGLKSASAARVDAKLDQLANSGEDLL